MSYQKPRWVGHGLSIGDGILRRDADLVPALIAMHDAAVDVWQKWWKDWYAMDPATRPAPKPPLYFDAVNLAGLGPLADWVGQIQRQRSEVRGLSHSPASGLTATRDRQ